jgi:hypothetical protein
VTDGRKLQKTETLTIRLDSQTRFILEFLSRYRGQTITTAVERALVDAANTVEIERGNGTRTWRDFWEVCEGARQLAVAKEPSLYPTFDEQLRVRFAHTYWPFFYRPNYPPKKGTQYKGTQYQVWWIDILWPNIDKYVKIWETERSKDWFAPARAMAKAIADTGLTPPDWQALLGAPEDDSLDEDASSEEATSSQEPSPAPPKSRRRKSRRRS